MEPEVSPEWVGEGEPEPEKEAAPAEVAIVSDFAPVAIPSVTDRGTGVIEEAVVRAAQTLDPSLGAEDRLMIALRLDQIINGMGSILTRMEGQDQEAVKLRDSLTKGLSRLDRLEAAMESWGNRQEEWREAAVRATEGVSPALRAQATAKAFQDLQQTTAAIKAHNDMQRISFAQQIKEMPQVTVVASGRPFFVRGQENTQEAVLMPTIITINGLTWKLPPGVPVKVPIIVKQRLDEMQLEREETSARQRLLSANRKGKYLEQDDVAGGWQAINDKFHAPADAFPLV